MTAGSLLQHLLPKDAISAVMYRIARSKRPWLARPLIGWFARTYRVDMSEAENADLASYPTFNEFFTRPLRAGARPIAGERDTIVSPADGVLTQFGTIDADTLLQAKGRSYSLAALLAESGPDVEALRGGSYCTIYLAPHNYHRVHTPLGGALVRTRYIPGRRFSVSRSTAAAIDRIFCRNERVACWLDTAAGPMVVVLVGALNVSSVSTFNRGEIVSGAAREWREDPSVPIERGAEIGRFNMGSTVILLFAPGAVRWDPQLVDGSAVTVGMRLGRIDDQAAAVD